MTDTHLGRQEAIARKEIIIAGANMEDEEWNEFCQKREDKTKKRCQEYRSIIILLNKLNCLFPSHQLNKITNFSLHQWNLP